MSACSRVFGSSCEKRYAIAPSNVSMTDAPVFSRMAKPSAVGFLRDRLLVDRLRPGQLLHRHLERTRQRAARLKAAIARRLNALDRLNVDPGRGCELLLHPVPH
jgi:hypothetical protein